MLHFASTWAIWASYSDVDRGASEGRFTEQRAVQRRAKQDLGICSSGSGGSDEQRDMHPRPRGHPHPACRNETWSAEDQKKFSDTAQRQVAWRRGSRKHLPAAKRSGVFASKAAPPAVSILMRLDKIHPSDPNNGRVDCIFKAKRSSQHCGPQGTPFTASSLFLLTRLHHFLPWSPSDVVLGCLGASGTCRSLQILPVRRCSWLAYNVGNRSIMSCPTVRCRKRGITDLI